MVEYSEIEEIPQVLTQEKMAEIMASVNRTLASSAETQANAQAVGVACEKMQASAQKTLAKADMVIAQSEK